MQILFLPVVMITVGAFIFGASLGHNTPSVPDWVAEWASAPHIACMTDWECDLIDGG